MTKLEEKLIELGYKPKGDIYYKYYYSNDNCVIVYNVIICDEYKVYDYKTMVAHPHSFFKNHHISTLEKAFYELNKHIEILKEVLEND